MPRTRQSADANACVYIRAKYRRFCSFQGKLQAERVRSFVKREDTRRNAGLGWRAGHGELGETAGREMDVGITIGFGSINLSNKFVPRQFPLFPLPRRLSKGVSIVGQNAANYKTQAGYPVHQTAMETKLDVANLTDKADCSFDADALDFWREDRERRLGQV